jgi:predicted Ser/Thr protein kinase
MEPLPLTCSHCGAALSSALEGMCPSCLLDVALGPPPAFPEGRFGDYELVEEIAQGGMGVVYRARQAALDRLVALKMLTGGELVSDAEVLRLHAEAKIAASLKHPNIVPIYDVGVHEEVAYFTMPLMEGGSLDEQMPRLHGRFLEVAQLLETITRAVHHGHQRGILHRDLKPANVLLDAAGIPYVADFGLAKALDMEAGVAQTGRVEGTLSYMALEQALPGGMPLTVAADVYSLGVILYQLLTGRLPFEAESLDRLLAKMKEGQPPAPRTHQPCLPRALEMICLKCLEREPTRRYGSAAELADDLRRFIEGRPTVARPVASIERVWMWCLRHPLGTGLLATLLWTLLVVAVGAVRIARAQEGDLRSEALRSNVYAARLMAGAVLFELAQYSQSVERAAAEPALVAALQERDAAAMEAFCKDRFTYYDGPPGGLRSSGACFILDTTGLGLAHWPPQPRTVVGKSYEWRDYFQGAKRLSDNGQRTAYVSRVIKSEGDDKYAFALSAPVYAADGRWLGVLMTLVASGSTLGSLRLNDASDSSRAATLVALTDRMRGQPTLPAADVYTVIVHEGLGRGMPVLLEPQTARQLERAFAESLPPGREQFQLPTFGGMALDSYRDPVSDEPGLWLAAFAPVGHTGFAVIVQTEEKAALAVNAQLARRIAWWSLPFVLGIGLVWLLFGWFRYRSWEERVE